MTTVGFVDAAALAGMLDRGRRIPGGWIARCPAHPDRTPSLSISDGDSATVFFCHAQCDAKTIFAALHRDHQITAEMLRHPDHRRQRRSKDDDDAGIGKLHQHHRQHKPKPEPEPEPLQKPAKPLPKGKTIQSWIYHHRDGTEAFAVVRRTPRKFSQWIPAENGLWRAAGPKAPRPLYRLPEIVESVGKVVVVEGEKCADAVANYWKTTVTTWSQGAGNWRHTDWTPVAARPVSMISDADEASRKHMRNLARHLLGLGCDVTLRLPRDQPKPGSKKTSGYDIADAIADAIADEWLSDITPSLITVPDTEAGDTNENTPPLSDEEIESRLEEIETGDRLANLTNNHHFRVLGLSGDQIAVWLKESGRVGYRSGEQLCTPNALIRLAPQRWWQKFTRSPAIGVMHARQIGDDLIRAADRLGPVDLTHLTGRGAVLTDNGPLYHLGDRLLVAGEIRSLEDDTRVFLAGPRIELGDTADADQMRDIAVAVMRYRWEDPDDGRRMLGWVVTAILGGALKWRPHILMTAPASSGKSWMLDEVLCPLLGSFMLRVADSTSAALARATGQASIPVVIDEAEPTNDWILHLIPQLRVASGGAGLRLRADVTGTGVNVQAPRYSALLSATAAPQLTRADASRLSTVRFGPSVADWPDVQKTILAAMVHADGVRARIIHKLDWVVSLADQLTKDLQGKGVDSREALISAALSAGWALWGIDDTIVAAGTGHGGQSDAVDALMDVLALRVRDSGTERSVLGLLQAQNRDAIVADLFGVRRAVGSILVLPKHRGLKRALDRSRWAGVDLSKLLSQIPGAVWTQHPRRFGAQRGRCLEFGPTVLDGLEVSLATVDNDEPVLYDESDAPPDF